MAKRVLIMEEVTYPEYDYYPDRCSNDRCDRDAKYHIGWEDIGTSPGASHLETYCSFACWLKDKVL